MGKIATREDLFRILNRYEAAVSAVEQDGDESQLSELEAARADVLNLLQQAKAEIGD